MAILLLTFAMVGARIVGVLEYVSRGVSLWDFVRFTISVLPIVLTFTIPWAVMVGVMLVFGRLSADNEITAMRACGVSILQIVSPILIITFLLTLLCLYLQVEVGPPLLGKSRTIMGEAVINQPAAMFEPGKAVEFEDSIIYVGDKVGNQLKDIQLYKVTGKSELAQDIAAKSGEFRIDEKKKIMTVELRDCVITDRNGGSSEGVERFYAETFRFDFNYGAQLNAENISNRPKFMRLSELMARIRMTKQLNHDTTSQEIELNQRIAFALSPIAFLLLGLPLAIRTSRRETSIGLFLSVILAGGFFLSIIVCESLDSYPQLYPQYLLWIPNIFFQLLGAFMTYRISRR